jgi:hypothetical protein
MKQRLWTFKDEEGRLYANVSYVKKALAGDKQRMIVDVQKNPKVYGDVEKCMKFIKNFKVVEIEMHEVKK